MKINRFVVMGAIALLVIGVLGTFAARSFVEAQDCAQEGQDSAEVQTAPETDTIDQQCGDQTTADTGTEIADSEVADAEATGENGQDAAPTGTPAITAEAAQKTAEAFLNVGTATKVELEDENGALVY